MPKPTFLMCGLLVIGLLLGACAGPNLGVPQTPEELGTIGAQIDRNPARMNAILTRNGLSEEEFQRAIRVISSDPALSERYHEGFKKARTPTKAPD